MASWLKVLLVIVVTALAGAVYFLFLRGPSPEEASRKVEEIRDLALSRKNCQAALEKAVAFVGENPEVVEGWHLKGVCEFELGQFDNAKASFQKVLALSPDHEAAKNYLEIFSSGGTLTVKE